MNPVRSGSNYNNSSESRAKPVDSIAARGVNPPISVCIVCFNEAANIRACLESVKWADEIVVVDSFSTDQTVDICRAYTAQVHQQKWPGYVAQKNFALGLARHDWVLALDADERVSDELRAEIEKEWAKKSYQDYTGYYIPRHTYYLGRWINHGGWYPDYKLRLFRKSIGQWTGIDPHDRVAISQGKTRQLKADLHHHNYKNISGQLQTIDSFSATQTTALTARGKKFSLFHLITRPPIKFLETYIFKLGFLDGLPGLIIAVNSAFYVFTKYAKMWEKDLSAQENTGK